MIRFERGGPFCRECLKQAHSFLRTHSFLMMVERRRVEDLRR